MLKKNAVYSGSVFVKFNSKKDKFNTCYLIPQHIKIRKIVGGDWLVSGDTESTEKW